MQYIDESKSVRISKGDIYDSATVVSNIIAILDDKLKAYGLEFSAKVTLDGDMVLDIVKKKITRTRRRKGGKGLLDLSGLNK